VVDERYESLHFTGSRATRSLRRLPEMSRRPEYEGLCSKQVSGNFIALENPLLRRLSPVERETVANAKTGEYIETLPFAA